MRVVFIGAGEVTVFAARALVGEGHDVVVVETDRARIDELGDRLDCSFLCGDGGRPEILREVGPKDTDILFCVTDDDRANIIASLVGRHLGFRRVVTSIRDADLEEVCRGLGLEDTIVPDRAISRRLCDTVHGLDSVELSSVLKNEARLLTLAVPENVHAVADLELPADVQPLWLYRETGFRPVAADTRLHVGDELVVLAHSSQLRELSDRFADHLVQSDAASAPPPSEA